MPYSAYYLPPNYGSIQTQERVNRSEELGGEFDFANDGTFNLPSTIAASGYMSIDIRQQTKYLDAPNHAPFNAISISNSSAQNVLCYLNTTYPTSIAKKFFVASLTDRTYDLAQVTGITIENLSTTTAINASEIRVLFIKSAFSSDTLAAKLAKQLSPMLSKPKPLFANKRF